MLDKIIVVTDLGPGDGGKGSVIHSLASRKDVSLIIKRGGAQGSHGVRTSQGEKFNFSQWGCGTLEGIPTYCSPQMILMPVGLENESNALKYHGIFDPYSMISADPRCVCATPYHKIDSQLSELFREHDPRGTIGTGVGKAYRMYKQLGDAITIRAADLTDRNALLKKIQMQVDYYRSKYDVSCRDDGLPEDAELVAENLDRLYDDGLIQFTVDAFYDVGKKLKLYRIDDIVKEYSGTAIVECSHGVLTDSKDGFQPHVSAIRTLPKFTAQMLKDAGFNGQLINYGVRRAYEIRHGAGPMATYDYEFTQKMLPDSHKEENRWQGIVRAGPLDLCLLYRALTSCVDTDFDGICLTWFDQILSTDRNWRICRDYANPYSPGQSLSNYYRNALPVYEDHLIPYPISKRDLFNLVVEIVKEYVGAPLKMLSIGPTEKDKIYEEDINYG